MTIRRLAVAAAFVSLSFHGAMANGTWVGAWGFTTLPQPPGMRLQGAPPQMPPSIPPLDSNVAVAQSITQPPPPMGQPILDNPGNVPLVLTGTNGIGNTTIRQLARVSASGKEIRLRLSNEDGSDALVLGAVHVGMAGPDGAVLPGSDHIVTFDGHPAISIPAGAPLLSDPVNLPVTALDRIAISIYVPGPVRSRGHDLWQYVAAAPGDTAAQPQLAGVRLAPLTALVTEIDVNATTAGNTVVTLGDSITEGAESTANAFRSWPDRLAERLAPNGKWSVVNVGIGGNRLLRYGAGPNALARFDRDVLSVPGVKIVILLEGINDIGRGFSPANAPEPVTAEALEAADKQIIARAHARGVRVIGATLTPYEGAGYFDPKGEEIREAVNHWILTGGAFDGVADFAAATADPAHPTNFRSDYNLSDHLHPNDAGYRAMGDAIDLKLITAGR